MCHQSKRRHGSGWRSRTRLHPPRRDGLAPGVEQPVLEADAVRGDTRVEAESGGEPGPTHGEDGEETRERAVGATVEEAAEPASGIHRLARDRLHPDDADDHDDDDDREEEDHDREGPPRGGDRPDESADGDAVHLALGRGRDGRGRGARGRRRGRRAGSRLVRGRGRRRRGGVAPTDARGERDDLVAERLRVFDLEVLQAHARRASPRHLDLELREPEDAGDERLDDVDRLEAVEPRLAVLPEQQPLALVHGVVVDAELVDAPGEPGHDDRDHRAGDEQEQRPHRAEPPEGFAIDGPELGERRERDDSDRPARMEHRRDGMEPGPALVDRGGRRAHRPARRASPRSVRRSRRRAASDAGTPDRWASVPGEAVWSWTRASPKARASGPAATSTYCMRP